MSRMIFKTLGSEEKSFFDTSENAGGKLYSTLLEEIKKIASENSDVQVYLDIYDNNEVRLNNIKKYLSQNLHLIPKNIILQLQLKNVNGETHAFGVPITADKSKFHMLSLKRIEEINQNIIKPSYDLKSKSPQSPFSPLSPLGVDAIRKNFSSNKVNGKGTLALAESVQKKAPEAKGEAFDKKFDDALTQWLATELNMSTSGGSSMLIVDSTKIDSVKANYTQYASDDLISHLTSQALPNENYLTDVLMLAPGQKGVSIALDYSGKRKITFEKDKNQSILMHTESSVGFKITITDHPELNLIIALPGTVTFTTQLKNNPNRFYLVDAKYPSDSVVEKIVEGKRFNEAEFGNVILDGLKATLDKSTDKTDAQKSLILLLTAMKLNIGHHEALKKLNLEKIALTPKQIAWLNQNNLAGLITNKMLDSYDKTAKQLREKIRSAHSIKDRQNALENYYQFIQDYPAEKKYTNLNLSGLDLRGKDFSEANFNNAHFDANTKIDSKTNLIDCIDLTENQRAILAHSQLSDELPSDTMESLNTETVLQSIFDRILVHDPALSEEQKLTESFLLLTDFLAIASENITKENGSATSADDTTPAFAHLFKKILSQYSEKTRNSITAALENIFDAFKGRKIEGSRSIRLADLGALLQNIKPSHLETEPAIAKVSDQIPWFSSIEITKQRALLLGNLTALEMATEKEAHEKVDDLIAFSQKRKPSQIINESENTNPIAMLTNDRLIPEPCVEKFLVDRFIEEYKRLYVAEAFKVSNWLESNAFKNKDTKAQVDAILTHIKESPNSLSEKAFAHAYYKTAKKLNPDNTDLLQRLSAELQITDASLALKEKTSETTFALPMQEKKQIPIKKDAVEKINHRAKEEIAGDAGFALFVADLTRGNFRAGNIRFYEYIAGLNNVSNFQVCIGNVSWERIDEKSRKAIITAFLEADIDKRKTQLEKALAGVSAQNEGENFRSLIYGWLKAAFPKLSQKTNDQLQKLIAPWYTPWSQDMAEPLSKLLIGEVRNINSQGQLEITRLPFAQYCATQGKQTAAYAAMQIPYFFLKTEGNLKFSYDGKKLKGKSTNVLNIALRDTSLCAGNEISWPIATADFLSARTKKEGSDNRYNFSIQAGSCDSDVITSLLSDPSALDKEQYPHIIYDALRKSIVDDTVKKEVANREKNILEKQSLTTNEKVSLLLRVANKLEIPANLSDIDLSGMDLQGVDLNNVIFDDKTKASPETLKKAKWDFYKHHILDPMTGTLLAEVIVDRKKFNHYFDKAETDPNAWGSMMHELYYKQVEATLRVCSDDEKGALLEKYKRFCEILHKPHDLSTFNLSGNYPLTITGQTILPKNNSLHTGKLTYEYHSRDNRAEPVYTRLDSHELANAKRKKEAALNIEKESRLSSSLAGRDEPIENISGHLKAEENLIALIDFSSILRDTFNKRKLNLPPQQNTLETLKYIEQRGTTEQKAALNYAKFEVLRQHFLLRKDKSISLDELKILVDAATQCGVEIQKAIHQLKLHNDEKYHYVDLNNTPKEINITDAWKHVSIKQNETDIPEKWKNNKLSVIEVVAEAYISPSTKKALYRELSAQDKLTSTNAKKTSEPAQNALNNDIVQTVLNTLLGNKKEFIEISHVETSREETTQAGTPPTKTSSDEFDLAEDATEIKDPSKNQPYGSYYSYNPKTNIATVVYADNNAIPALGNDVSRFQITANEVLKKHPTAHITHILPEEGYGRLGSFNPKSHHIRLQIIEQQPTESFADCKKRAHEFDPRDIGLNAQSTFDDTNCGRYVLAMTMQAVGLSTHGQKITRENLSATPAIQAAVHLNTKEDLITGLRNAYVPPLSKGETDLHKKIQHYQAVIRSLAAEYQARSESREYHGTTLFGKYRSSFFSGGFTGFSASEKLSAVKEIEFLLNNETTGQEIKSKALPKAALQGRLGDAVKALVEAENALSNHQRKAFKM